MSRRDSAVGRTGDGARPSADPYGTRRLGADFRGELLTPADGRGYDRARAVWNARIDRHPASVARCTGVADVLRTLAAARAFGGDVAVRGGGHDVAGQRRVRTRRRHRPISHEGHPDRPDAVRRARPGRPDLDRTGPGDQAFGLATTGGQCSATGVAGVTLGGGLCWLTRRNGLTVDNLVSADDVTADGRLLTASEHDDVTSTVISLTAPPLPALRPELHGAPAVAIGACYSGPREDADDVLGPLRQFGPPAADLVVPMASTRPMRTSDRRTARQPRRVAGTHTSGGPSV